MKRKIFLMSLALALFFPSLFILQACGEKPKVIHVNSAAGFERALERVKDGGTIILKDDIVLNKQISITKKITLDLNENTISNSKNIWKDSESSKKDKFGLLCVRSGGNLTITGNGTIDTLENDCYAIWLDAENAILTIIDGTITGNVSAIYARQGNVEILGGTFDIKKLSQHDDSRYLLDCLDENYLSQTANFVVKGGTYKNFNPAGNLSEGANTSYVAEGYSVSALTSAEGTSYTVNAN